VVFSFKQMPFLLKFLALLGCSGIFFIIGPFFPFAKFQIEGRTVSINEFWSSGVAIGFIVTGVLLLISGIKTINKNHMGRFYFLIAFVSAYLNPHAIMNGYLFDQNYLFGLFVPIGFFSWYLYMKKSVRIYFFDAEH